ncbi:MAG TPA: S8 family serine peptidase [Segeticoccus sp.]|uniref:S8 family peptidase n=1 Tax=Segeticoccus sp. TaxID=2706531 RepID=UPI002D7E284C|nr:S8 family serine peptidase [Segeticoccus sp.]HET8599018.1 S8 family serine peptidase [Segeticoccus sp.]
MAHHRPRRRTLLALASAAVVTASCYGGAALAAPAPDEPPSTHVPVPTPEGMLMSYVVNAKQANPGQTRLAEQAVRDAGGVVAQSWPQIGVVIAHSTHATFRTDVVRLAKGHAVESAGPTRTAAVTEGTPDALPASKAPGSRGASAYQKKGQHKVAGYYAGADVVAAAPAADPREGEQWDMAMIKADAAHALTDGSRNVVVGVLDSGIESAHPDLAPNIDAKDSVSCINAGRPDQTPGSWEPTTSGHGTHVAGTIAAARNGIGIVGVAPNVRLASVKVVNDAGFIYPEYAVCGFVWAADHGMDVTNNSYYVDPFEFWCGDQPEQAPALEAVRRAVAYSEKKGVVSAAAAGNSSYDLSNKTTNDSSPNDADEPVLRTINSSCQDIPAELDGVVTTSSLTSSGALSSFSNRGLGSIDVSAPGSSVLSTWPWGGYAKLSGTSMASPHAAGVLALLKSTHPNASPAELVRLLRAQADDHVCTTAARGAACVGTEQDNSYYGEGIVDALDAVK